MLNDRLIRIYLSCRLLTGAGLIAVTEFPLKFASARSCGKLSFLSRNYKRVRNTFINSELVSAVLKVYVLGISRCEQVLHSCILLSNIPEDT